MKNQYIIFVKNITKVRAMLGMSARELSEKAGLKQLKRISDLEEGRGCPSLDEVCSICKVLNQSIDSMLYKEAKAIIIFNDTNDNLPTLHN